MTRFGLTLEGAHGQSRERHGQEPMGVWDPGEEPRAPRASGKLSGRRSQPRLQTPVWSLILLFGDVVEWR